MKHFTNVHYATNWVRRNAEGACCVLIGKGRNQRHFEFVRDFKHGGGWLRGTLDRSGYAYVRVDAVP